MKYKIDVVRIRENSITLNGWVLYTYIYSGPHSGWRTKSTNR